MKIIRNNRDLEDILNDLKQNFPSKSIGFVPTMGALHSGHLSLIHHAQITCDVVVCSIFVNPTQFNEKSDLDKYPRTIEADIELLKIHNCDILFIPSEHDIYPNKLNKYSIDLEGLDRVMEGKFRNNHFEGVCMVVERLFNLVKPHCAFFGIKDFQQVAIIKHMVKIRKFDIKIIACPIKRDSNGLALSSRNSLLSDQEKIDATILSKALFSGLGAHQNHLKINNVKDIMINTLNLGKLKLEYIEVVDNLTLQPVEEISSSTTVCIAAYCGKVRLIDNCQFS